MIRSCCPEITPVAQKGGKLLQFLLLVVILKNATHISVVRILFNLNQSRVFFFFNYQKSMLVTAHFEGTQVFRLNNQGW